MLAVTFCEMGGGQDENYVLGGAESWVSDSNGGTQQPLGVASWGGGRRISASIPDIWISVSVYLSNKPPFP